MLLLKRLIMRWMPRFIFVVAIIFLVAVVYSLSEAEFHQKTFFLPSHHLCLAEIKKDSIIKEKYLNAYIEFQKAKKYKIKRFGLDKKEALRSRLSCIQTGGIWLRVKKNHELEDNCIFDKENLPGVCRQLLQQ